MILTSIPCSRLSTFQKPVAITEVRARPILPFRQAWREESEAGFLPGRVQMGWTPEGFVVWAELEDRDIFNPVRKFNEPAFLKGDVFEIFMRPEACETYYEFHITPCNQLFQYRIPSAAAFRAQRRNGICQEWLMSSSVLESSTEIDQLKKRWQVSVKIPMEKLGRSPLKEHDRWNFSFCRYDYSRNREQPVLSSVSPLKKVDFHDQSCWMCAELV